MTVFESYFNNEFFNGFENRSWKVEVWGSYWVKNIPYFLTFQMLRMWFKELDNLWLLARLSSSHVFGYPWPWLFGYLLLPWPVYLCFLVQGIPGSLANVSLVPWTGYLCFLDRVSLAPWPGFFYGSGTGYLWFLCQVISGSFVKLSLVPLSSYHCSLARQTF